MTTPDVRQSRAHVVRIIAASMAFDQDPPVTRSLSAARRAADGVYDALVGAGVLVGDGSTASSNGKAADSDDDDGEPLFPDNGLSNDPEA